MKKIDYFVTILVHFYTNLINNKYMKIHLRDSEERRHYLVRRLDTIDTKIDTFYTGTFKALESKDLNPHKHSFLEIMFIDSGQGTIEIEKKNYKASKDDIVIYLPNHMHKEYSDKNTMMHAYFFGVKYTHSLKNMFESCNPPFVFGSGQYSSLFLKLFKTLINESKGDIVAYSDKITNCIVKTIILKILQISSKNKEAAKSNKFIKEIQNYLDNHYLEDIKLDEYYDSLPFSKYYIARLFKTCMGVTPMNYIISKRIDSARELLINSNKKIKDICNEVGYKDIYYFTKVFKKEIGVSPSEYRKHRI